MRERTLLRLLYDRKNNIILRASLPELRGRTLEESLAEEKVRAILSDMRGIGGENLFAMIDGLKTDAQVKSFGSVSGNAFYTVSIETTRRGNFRISLVRTPLIQGISTERHVRVIAAIVIAAVLAASVLLCLYMRQDMYDKKNADANETVEMVSKQIDKTVSAEFDSWFNDLNMIGTLLLDYPVFSGNEEHVDEVLDVIRPSLPFRDVGLLLETGNLYFDSENVINIAYEKLTRKLVIDGEAAIDCVDLAGEEYVVFGIPVSRGARQEVGRIAAICGVAEIGAISELLPINAFGNSTITSIIKDDGFRVAVSESSLVDGNWEYQNLFTMIGRLVGAKEYAAFETAYLAGQSGMIKIDGESENFYVYYSPLQINTEELSNAEKWHVVIYVPESAIFSSVSQMFNTIMIVTVLLLLFASLVVAYLVLMYLRKRNLDILTNRRLMEVEVLEMAAKQAEEANHAKTVFFSNMSHDMRTPLNGIIGMSAIAKNHIDDPATVKDCIDKIVGAGEHMLSLVNNVLDISRIESNRVEILHEPMNIERIVSECGSIIDGQIETRNLHFTLNMSSLRYPDVVGDALHLRQVLINLLGNAVKFTPDGGTVSLTVKELSEGEGRVTYEFRVKDSGIGMSQEFAEHMFEPFTQEHRADGEGLQTQGSGLGLAISSQFVRLMGGEITAKSGIGEGTEMTVTIPFEISTETALEAERHKEEIRRVTESAVAADLSGTRVLLVEDNELNREIATVLLTENGLTVEEAANGKEACEKFLSHTEHYYDVILMDVMMPVMDGLAATRVIRASDNPNAKNVPILAMTANVFEDDIRHTREAGMNDHLSKPIQIAEVLKSIRTFTAVKIQNLSNAE